MTGSLPGIVLAAGGSRRFGAVNKLLLPYRGRALACHALQALIDASWVAPVFLVVGHQRDRLLAALEQGIRGRGHPKLRVLHNARWSTGRASSLKAALDALPPEAPGALVTPADLPLLTFELVDRVARGCLESGRLCFPVYNGQKGHPVAFPKGWLRKLRRLEGDRSGYDLIKAHWEEALKLELSGDEVRTQRSVETPQDYQRLLEWESKLEEG